VIIAAIISALAALVTAVGGVLIAYRVLIPIVRKTDEVHALVNSNREDMLRREEVLIAALQHAGVKIPPNAALHGEDTQ